MPFYFLLLTLFAACTSRNHIESQSPVSQTSMRTLPAGGCEGCELMFTDMPTSLLSSDTSDGWFEEGQKLIISGKVLHPDKKTPAKGVIIYYYHTDQKGYYDPGDKTDAGSRRHGRLRGWVETDAEGNYAIYTSRPAQYPSNNAEAHIHVIIKEPDLNIPYWIDAWVFDDDPLLSPAIRKRLENRGGSGIMKTELIDGIQVAKQDIILGLNVPGYPEK